MSQTLTNIQLFNSAQHPLMNVGLSPYVFCNCGLWIQLQSHSLCGTTYGMGNGRASCTGVLCSLLPGIQGGTLAQNRLDINFSVWVPWRTRKEQIWIPSWHKAQKRDFNFPRVMFFIQSQRLDTSMLIVGIFSRESHHYRSTLPASWFMWLFIPTLCLIWTQNCTSHAQV